MPETGWAEYSKDDGNVHTHQWRRNDDPGDTFSTLVSLGESIDINAYHDFIEAKAKKNCIEHSSRLVEIVGSTF